MNTPIRRLSIFTMALFAILMLNLTWIQGFRADALIEDPLNTRQYSEHLSRPRGPIEVAGESIAFSEDVSEEGGSPLYQREYTGGGMYTPITGVLSVYSTTGIERAQNSLLDGTDDRLAVRNFRDIITGRDPEGARVQLTLNPAVQEAGYTAFRDGGLQGAAVALDPNTGAVLGAVSYPTFDANDVASVTDRNTAVANFQALENDPDQPLLNRAFEARYPPGSTFKVVTAAAAIEYLDATPETTQEAPDSLTFPTGPPLPNATSGGTCNGGAPDTLAHSIQISCNTSMANWAIDVGGQNLSDQAAAFGFNPPEGEELQVPLDVIASNAPVETEESILGRAGIGQANVEATPLQMAMVAAGVANQGEVMRPYVVDSVLDSDMSVVTETQPESFSQAVEPSTAEDLRDMMVLVTGPNGSGTNAAIPNVEVAGKTGTAETGGDQGTHNWFIGFAPADDPEIAVAVVVEHGGASGNQLAAPIARAMMEAVVLE
ncbi:penicillin-binding protein 2 [Nocardiopsis sp. FIRDI 009]|uniref:peptidoglycan D,D-transpeptidase FtsI family protein n=1 Tax=Nocardiopsis sp. FIRDI 009 TaxID=714197 RepID=UPI000E249797|nr:penicillin-binding protein 2 [Nocardiopsis sp. FIRDI 009]